MNDMHEKVVEGDKNLRWKRNWRPVPRYIQEGLSVCAQYWS